MADEREAELIDYLAVVWRWRWLVVLGTVAGVLAGGLVSWSSPRIYRVTAVLDAGDLNDTGLKDAERLVARLNARGAIGSDGAGSPAPAVGMTVEFRKPFLIELRAETRSPADGVSALERAAAGAVEELNRLLRLQDEARQGKLDALRAQVQLVEREADSLLGQLRLEVERRVRTAQAALQLTRGDRIRLEQRRVLSQQRLDHLRRTVTELRAARAQELRATDSLVRALVAGQLSSEILASEERAALLEQGLGVEIPAKAEQLALQERGLVEQLGVLGGARKALDGRAALTTASTLPMVREAVYRTTGSGPDDLAAAAAVESVLRKAEIELPERRRTLVQQVDEIEKSAVAIRPARLVAPPTLPAHPVRPRVALSLALGLAAGAAGAVLLSFFAEYVRQARRPRGAGA
jgi:hypothetical protein